MRFLRFFTFLTIFLFFLLLLYYFLRHFSQTLSAHIVVCDVIYAAAYNDVVIVLTGRPLFHRMVFSFGFLRLPSLTLFFWHTLTRSAQYRSRPFTNNRFNTFSTHNPTIILFIGINNV